MLVLHIVFWYEISIFVYFVLDLTYNVIYFLFEKQAFMDY